MQCQKLLSDHVCVCLHMSSLCLNVSVGTKVYPPLQTWLYHRCCAIPALMHRLVQAPPQAPFSPTRPPLPVSQQALSQASFSPLPGLLGLVERCCRADMQLLARGSTLQQTHTERDRSQNAEAPHQPHKATCARHLHINAHKRSPKPPSPLPGLSVKRLGLAPNHLTSSAAPGLPPPCLGCTTQLASQGPQHQAQPHQRHRQHPPEPGAHPLCGSAAARVLWAEAGLQSKDRRMHSLDQSSTF
jgi:hypothetical protein